MKNILQEIIKSSQFPEGVAWKRRHYQVNDIVVKKGETGDSLFFVEQGELRVTGRVELENKKHIQPGIGELKAGTLFGEACLHKAMPRMATVTAITEATLLEINGQCLTVYLDANPAQGYLFYKQLFEIFISRLDKANHTIASLMAWGLKAHEIEQYL